MKTYICDCCGEQIKNPFKVKMVQFLIGIDFEYGLPDPFKRKEKIDLCGDCWDYVKKRKWREE